MLMTSIAILLAACGGQDSGSAAQAGATQPSLLASVTKVDAAPAVAAAQAAGTPSAAASTANLYVSAAIGKDTNPGTSATAPLRTIQRASSLAKPGTTVHVAPGTYAETISSSSSGTAAAHIRYVSDQKWKAVIKRAGAGGYTMWAVTGGYNDIDGFDIDGTGGTSTRIGVFLTGGNSSLMNSTIHDVAQSSGCDNRGGGGLVTNQARSATTAINYTITGNVVHHVGGGCTYIQGIYHQSTGKINNNVVYASSTGINMGHDVHNTIVMNNTVFNNTGYGVRFGGCQEGYNTGCPTYGIQVHNNIIYGNRGGITAPIASEDVGNNISTNLVYANSTNFDVASNGSAGKTKTGMITVDPQFVGYIASGGGNYHLKSTSPAIGKGLVANAPAYDIDGKARGAAIDMGAYEF
jgi:hypothetical protein